MDLSRVIHQAAAQGHRAACSDPEHCPGPTDAELLTAATVVYTALPEIFDQITRGVAAVVKGAESGQYGAGGPDATATGAEELLREWFHWWRTADDAPTKVPGQLHVATVAYLAAQGVSQGRRIRSAADV